jgi:hypothetical protein
VIQQSHLMGTNHLTIFLRDGMACFLITTPFNTLGFAIKLATLEVSVPFLWPGLKTLSSLTPLDLILSLSTTVTVVANRLPIASRKMVSRYPFPSTDRFPFDCLETFHELTLQGKTSLYDYYNTLLRRFDNAGISNPIVSSV